MACATSTAAALVTPDPCGDLLGALLGELK
jgi:hypothetical protein